MSEETEVTPEEVKVETAVDHEIEAEAPAVEAVVVEKAEVSLSELVEKFEALVAKLAKHGIHAG